MLTADQISKWNIGSNISILNAGLASNNGNSVNAEGVQLYEDGSKTSSTNRYFELQKFAMDSVDNSVKNCPVADNVAYEVPALSIGITEKKATLLAAQRNNQLYSLSRADFYKQAATEANTNFKITQQTSTLCTSMIDSLVKIME